MDNTVEGSGSRGCRQLDFGRERLVPTQPQQISGSMKYIQRDTLGSGRRLQQNYSMDFETATAVVAPSSSPSPSPSPTPSPSPSANSSMNGSMPVVPTPDNNDTTPVEPWEGWTRVTGPITVTRLQPGQSTATKEESFQGCAYLFFDPSRQEVTAQISSDPRRACMSSPTQGRTDVDRFVGYREDTAVQCLPDGSAPGAVGPRGPARGGIPGEVLPPAVQGYFKGFPGSGVACSGAQVFDSSFRVYRQLSPMAG